jgi:hypothetical protein
MAGFAQCRFAEAAANQLVKCGARNVLAMLQTMLCKVMTVPSAQEITGGSG